MSTLNIHILYRKSVEFPEFAIFASRPGAMNIFGRFFFCFFKVKVGTKRQNKIVYKCG